MTVREITFAEDCIRYQRATITENGSGYILSWDDHASGEHQEKWFSTLPDCYGVFLMFVYDFTYQTFSDDDRRAWLD